MGYDIKLTHKGKIICNFYLNDVIIDIFAKLNTKFLFFVALKFFIEHCSFLKLKKCQIFIFKKYGCINI